MKLWKCVFALALCLLLTACAPAAETPEDPARTEAPVTAADPADVPPSLAEDEEPTILTCRIVDGAEDGNLLLAELGDGLYGGTGVYRLNGKDVAVTLDGEAAEPSALEDGMVVEVAFNGSVLESFPAQFGEVYQIAGYSIGSEKNPAGTCYDLCGLYLQVLDDLWEKDKGLNENISLAGLDLSNAPGELTESEKAALAWRFGEMHGVEVVQGTFQELKEQGYLTSEPLGDGAPEGAAFVHWEDGCLFSITPSEDHEGESYSLPTLFFNAAKWRSSLGAYGFYDCSAMWPQGGTWNGYQIGSEMIS
nr:hypothetical protein [uncultured Oscillibacter sp.]